MTASAPQSTLPALPRYDAEQSASSGSGGSIAPAASAWCGWLGAAGFLVGILVADYAGRSSSHAVALEALIAVISALLLIVCCLRQSAVSQALSSRAPVWVGERTYGIYLLHVPILLVLQKTVAGRGLVTPLTLFLTIFWAALSYRYVERPLQRHFTTITTTSRNARHAKDVKSETSNPPSSLVTSAMYPLLKPPDTL